MGESLCPLPQLLKGEIKMIDKTLIEKVLSDPEVVNLIATKFLNALTPPIQDPRLPYILDDRLEIIYRELGDMTQEEAINTIIDNMTNMEIKAVIGDNFNREEDADRLISLLSYSQIYRIVDRIKVVFCHKPHQLILKKATQIGAGSKITIGTDTPKKDTQMGAKQDSDFSSHFRNVCPHGAVIGLGKTSGEQKETIKERMARAWMRYHEKRT